MRISGIRFTPVERGGKGLLAYATCELSDDSGMMFVVHEIRVIWLADERRYMIAFPSRDVNDRCDRCHAKNSWKNYYCGGCGSRLPPKEKRPFMVTERPGDRPKLHLDNIHPGNPKTRHYFEREIIAAYERACQGTAITA